MAHRVTEHAVAKDRNARKGDSVASSKHSLILLGIDPGLDRTGYAVIEAAGRRIRDAGLIRSTSDDSLARRLREIDIGLEEVLTEHDVGLVAVEDLYAHYKHPRTAILMGHARGVILLAAARHGVEVLSLPATAVKKTLTGNGHASKNQVQRAIMTTLKLAEVPEPPDVADALAVALCAAITRPCTADN